MNYDIKTNYNFSVKNVNFFKNALALLNVDDNKYNSNLKKSSENLVERENLILFNLYYDGIKLRSLSKCKQIYCFLYMDSNCFTSYNFFEKEENEKKYEMDYNKYETNSVNSDNLFTTHAIDDEKEDVVKLKTLSPLKMNSTQKSENEDEYNIRKKIYTEIDEKKNHIEFLVSPYELLRALEFLDAVILNIKFDYSNKKLILQLTDEDGDTSETFIKIIVDYFYEIYKLEKYSFLNNDYNYFSLQSEIFSFYLEYLIKCNDQYITFYINEYANDSTSILKMETKNKNYERAVQLMPKETFDEFKSLKNQMFKYRIKDLSKINHALKISSHLRMDFQENGLLRFQFTLREYNLNGTHLCYFIQPIPDFNTLNGNEL
ncbi:conserved Plasmodium protein, unknown function [Plasmodium relictum]|uniref:Uncharacterized protein n=1 Tax=Plasmodium relictum TaxID=85471 RepID=A0A1J1HCK2_PLARL|nr:conserved Plasmodium protein, unknown function [Plasmodium relictum]CRH01314.1 conserved Plasmodium protein, unknown function [Plasmodium relictum]